MYCFLPPTSSTLSPLIVQGFACVFLRVRHKPFRSWRVWVRGIACVFVRVRRSPCQYVSVLECVGQRYRVRIRACAPQTLPIRFGPCVCGPEVSRAYACVRATNPTDALRSLRVWVRGIACVFVRARNETLPIRVGLACVRQRCRVPIRARAPRVDDL